MPSDDPGSVLELLARSRVFGALDAAERAVLAQRMRSLKLQPGQVLFSRGAPGGEVYLVARGRIRLSTLSSEGRELSFAHAGPGDLIGEIAALDGGSRSADATAITEARLMSVAQSVFIGLLQKNQKACFAALAMLCNRLRDLSDHAEAIALHPIEVRVARVLLDRLGTERLGRGSDTVSLALEISQTELALLAGSTRQRANGALATLERAGAISRKGKLLMIVQDHLLEIAERD